jgi:hypothetical protein
MSVEVHLDWAGETHFVGRLHTAEHNPAISFEYSPEWLGRPGAFAIDPSSLPLRPGAFHSRTLFGAIQDCGPDHWGRTLIARAVRKHVLDQKPYQDLDYVLALDDISRIGALRFGWGAGDPFLAAGAGRIPPVVQIGALLNAANAVHGKLRPPKTCVTCWPRAPRLAAHGQKAAVVLPRWPVRDGKVSHWRMTGGKLRIKAGTLDAYDTDFENPLIDEARRIL